MPHHHLTIYWIWEEFCQDTSIEKTGWYLQGTDVENGSDLNDLVNYSYCLESFENSLSSNYTEIKPERMDHRISCDQKLSGSPFVLTSTVKQSFEMVIMAVSQRWPVLLHGPVGAGKSALINRYLNQHNKKPKHNKRKKDYTTPDWKSKNTRSSNTKI